LIINYADFLDFVVFLVSESFILIKANLFSAIFSFSFFNSANLVSEEFNLFFKDVTFSSSVSISSEFEVSLISSLEIVHSNI
jgi:hypothetical protein